MSTSITIAINLATLLIQWDGNAYTNFAEELDRADEDDRETLLLTLAQMPGDGAANLLAALTDRYRE